MSTLNFSQYFPDYEILSELGKSNARVVKARHKATGEIVAIKYYFFNADEKTLTRFQRESEIMEKLDHPNIVKIKDVQLTATIPYIVMEYVEGGDVRSLLKEYGSLDVPTVIRLGQQVVQALEAIHEMHIIHRDIKPDNIIYRRMSSGELHFLLTDFGISKIRGSILVTVAGQSPMTLEYASPEQFDDSNKVSFATDYYSLGVVLYECLSGVVPFPIGSKGPSGYGRVVEKELPPKLILPENKFLPENLRHIVDKLLTKQSMNRLTDPYEIGDGLAQAVVEWRLNHRNKVPVSNAKINSFNPIVIKSEFENHSKITIDIKNDHWKDKYSYLGEFNNGLALALRKENVKYGYVNSDGQEITTFEYDWGGDFSENIAEVQKNGYYGYINSRGSLIIPLIYNFSYPFSEGLAAVRKKDKWGFINKIGNNIIPFEYDKVQSFSEGFAVVEKEKKYGFIDKNGIEIIPLIYLQANSFNQGLALVNINYKFGFINKLGEVIIPVEYDVIEPFACGLAAVSKNKKYGFIDRTGKIIVPLEYNKVNAFVDGLAVVKKNEYYGYLDTSGNVAIPFQFDFAYSFSKGIARVVKDKIGGLIDYNGKFIPIKK